MLLKRKDFLAYFQVALLAPLLIIIKLLEQADSSVLQLCEMLLVSTLNLRYLKLDVFHLELNLRLANALNSSKYAELPFSSCFPQARRCCSRC